MGDILGLRHGRHRYLAALFALHVVALFALHVMQWKNCMWLLSHASGLTKCMYTVSTLTC